MSEPEDIQNALEALQTGDFHKAWDLYGRLLELFPADADYQCGFYSAGYWNNRHDDIVTHKPGRLRGAFLYRQWDDFQKLAEEKNFTGCLSFRAVMKFVLGQAAEELRHAYLEEGGRSMDAGLLIDLGRCLIRIEDYRNALDILNFTRKAHSNNGTVLFLLGEALCSMDREELVRQGLGYYRDSFLIDPALIDPALIASPAVSEVFRRLFEEKEERLETVLEWLPATLMAEYFSVPYRRLSEMEIHRLEQETRRLSESLKEVVEKYRDRVRARTAFYCLVLMQTFQALGEHSLAAEYESLLREVAPELQERAREKR